MPRELRRLSAAGLLADSNVVQQKFFWGLQEKGVDEGAVRLAPESKLENRRFGARGGRPRARRWEFDSGRVAPTTEMAYERAQKAMVVFMLCGGGSCNGLHPGNIAGFYTFS